MTHHDGCPGVPRVPGAPPPPGERAAPLPGRPGARYDAMLTALRAGGEGAFVPFFVLGDPDLETSARLLHEAVLAGADALEVGIPFSDPVADGPVLQRANLRAAAAGAVPAACFELLAAFRQAHPHVPVGLLTYANLAVCDGVEAFYRRAAEAGIDSVLVADVPLLEAEPFSRAARACGVAPVLLAPPNLPVNRIQRICELSDGYTYVVARRGVTGAAAGAVSAHLPLIEPLLAAGAPPPMVGFGVSAPEHVRPLLAAGAAGVISGSAIAALIEAAVDRGPVTAGHGAPVTSGHGGPVTSGHRGLPLEAVAAFVRRMKGATKAQP